MVLSKFVNFTRTVGKIIDGSLTKTNSRIIFPRPDADDFDTESDEDY